MPDAADALKVRAASGVDLDQLSSESVAKITILPAKQIPIDIPCVRTQLMQWQTLGDKLPQTRNPVTRLIGRGVLALLGWRVDGIFPNRHKFVVALVPHRSNMDFILTIAVLWGVGLRASFLMKHTLFWFPLGNLLRALGGIAIDRRAPQGLVMQMTEEFKRRPSMVLGITPEGTRRGVSEIKQGFAQIAAAAQVSVLPAVLDYKNRVIHLAELIEETANVDAVIAQIRGMIDAQVVAQ